MQLLGRCHVSTWGVQQQKGQQPDPLPPLQHLSHPVHFLERQVVLQNAIQQLSLCSVPVNGTFCVVELCMGHNTVVVTKQRHCMAWA